MLVWSCEGRRVPAWITRKFAAELDALLKVLLERGVTAHRPTAVKPLPGEPAGLGQMFSRDPIMVVGERIIDGQLQIAMRRKERRGLDELLNRLKQNGAWVSPVPPEGAFLEGGDVIVDLPYVYVGISRYGNQHKALKRRRM